ncbi:ABC transporter ATP-binding protein [Cyanobacterium aponinum]|uniref:ABC transporter ATP-binding protein n=1 Tax=Cyanobacterium aponinum TaxID=379064 RepID=UPI000C12DFCA|nr:ABC transporter ATP-binding protein [Cyanobacterium aponinum]PHV63527.1 multidrug ABC transporter ATP-binding protein [Cyanobacterium aponinum IPPAS B-1201]
MIATANLSENNDTRSLAVVETYKLSKVYVTGFWMNKKIPSLNDCTLKVYKGETFGLLGPNGAGKTTLLKTLLGIIRPTSGKALLLGKPLGDRQVKQRLGYLPENAYYYDFLTAWEFLSFIADLFKIPKSQQKQKILQLLDLVGLAKQTAQKKQLRQYSKGMMQRVGMAQALINDPEIVFFDEPMSGLDPLGRYQVRQIILSLKEQGKTIFFNSHVLSDVEKICDRIAILARGELLKVGSLDEILGTKKSYHVVLKQGENNNDWNQWLTHIKQENNFISGELTGNQEEFIHYVKSICAELISMNLSRDSLEEYFIRILEEKGITSSQ